MTVIAFVIRKDKQKSNGRIPVYLRIAHNGKTAYKTYGITLSEGQISKSGEIKDHNIRTQCDKMVEELYQYVGKNIFRVDKMTAQELSDYIDTYENELDFKLDFLEYSRKVIDKIKLKGRAGTAANHFYAIKALEREMGSRIDISDINAKFLERFEDKLKKAEMTRGVSLYLGSIRTLFNIARNEFNDEDRGIIKIKHNPWIKYKIPDQPETTPRVLSIDQIQSIIEKIDISGTILTQTREQLGINVFILSFALFGTNTVDLFNATQYDNGRLVYYRTKTVGRMKSRAKISIKVPEQIVDLFNSYLDPDGKRVFSFYKRFSDYKCFNKAINKGLQQYMPSITTYYARHTMASHMRNKAGVPKDVVHLCLNHGSNDGMKMTDIYLEEDWSIYDEANLKLLNLYIWNRHLH